MTKAKGARKDRDCVMDFPAAWAFVRTTNEKDHDPNCSWVGWGMLCDCRVLYDEYDRRERRMAQRKKVKR